MEKFMFIDESGDLGLKGSKYIILACLTTETPEKLDRIIKNMRRNKFKKQLKKSNEIKASKSKSSLIEHMIKKINELETTCVHFIVLEKGKLYSDFLKNNKHKLYNFVAGKLACRMIINSSKVIVRIDKSKGKQILREDFNNYFSEKLLEKSDIDKIKIYHSYSHSWSGLQFADILSWSCYQKFEFGNNNFLELLDSDKREIFFVF